MKKVVLILILMGILIGPGYLIYCNFFSGKLGAHYLVYSRDVQEFSGGGASAVRAGAETWHNPNNITLTPDLNPLSLSVKARYIPSIGGLTKSAGFNATLNKDGQRVWTEDFLIRPSSDKKDSKKISIGGINLPSIHTMIKTFNVDQPGKYSLAIKKAGGTGLIVKDLKLKLRTNIMVPNKTVYLTGFGMLVGGFIVGAATGKKKNKD